MAAQANEKAPAGWHGTWIYAPPWVAATATTGGHEAVGPAHGTDPTTPSSNGSPPRVCEHARGVFEDGRSIPAWPPVAVARPALSATYGGDPADLDEHRRVLDADLADPRPEGLSLGLQLGVTARLGDTRIDDRVELRDGLRVMRVVVEVRRGRRAGDPKGEAVDQPDDLGSAKGRVMDRPHDRVDDGHPVVDQDVGLLGSVCSSRYISATMTQPPDRTTRCMSPSDRDRVVEVVEGRARSRRCRMTRHLGDDRSEVRLLEPDGAATDRGRLEGVAAGAVEVDAEDLVVARQAVGQEFDEAAASRRDVKDPATVDVAEDPPRLGGAVSHAPAPSRLVPTDGTPGAAGRQAHLSAVTGR